MNPGIQHNNRYARVIRTLVGTIRDRRCDLFSRRLISILIGALFSCSLTIASASNLFDAGVKAFLVHDYDGAAKVWRPLAQNGHLESMYNLGQLALTPAINDSTEGVKWLTRAAERDHTPSQIALGLTYATGNGVDVDSELAQQWLRTAAESGDSHAQYYLGRLHVTGQLGEVNHVQAQTWLNQSAEQGDLRAAALLARIDGRRIVRFDDLANLIRTTNDTVAALSQPDKVSSDGVTAPSPSAQTPAAIQDDEPLNAPVATVAVEAPTTSQSITAIALNSDSEGEGTSKQTDQQSSALQSSSVSVEADDDSSTQQATAVLEPTTTDVVSDEVASTQEADNNSVDSLLAVVETKQPAQSVAVSVTTVDESSDEPSMEVDTTTAQEVTINDESQSVQVAKLAEPQQTGTSALSLLPVQDAVDPEDPAWLAALQPQHYTVQLYVTSDRESAQAFIDKHQLTAARYFKQESNNASWFKIIMGDHSEAQAAKLSRANLSSELQRYSPWVRSFESVQRELGLDNTTPETSSGIQTASLAGSETSDADAPDRVIVPALMPATSDNLTVVTVSDDVPEAEVTRSAAGATATTQTELPAIVGVAAATDDSSEAVVGPSVRLADRHDIDQIAYRTGQRAYNRRDYVNAMSLWEPLANAGYADAQYGVGFMYEAGWGVEQSYAKANYWYTLAAQQGYAKAQYQLGMLFLNGNGIEQDETIGTYWIQSAADQYDSRAAEELLRLRAKAQE